MNNLESFIPQASQTSIDPVAQNISPEEKNTIISFIASNIVTWSLELLAVLLLLIYLLRIFVMQDYTVSGKSMQPTIEDGQRLMVNTWAYLLHGPKRGDIVVLIPPDRVDENFVKRIVALPGETLEIRGDNQVIIYNDSYPNGITLREAYIPETQQTEAFIREKMGTDEYFVLGDNRTGSSDSRGNITDIDTTWHLPKKNIVGKAIIVLEPTKNVFELGIIKIPRIHFLSTPNYNL